MLAGAARAGLATLIAPGQGRLRERGAVR